MNNILPLIYLLAELGNVTDGIIQAVKSGGGVMKAIAQVFRLSDELGAMVGVDWSLIDDEWKQSREEGHATVIAELKKKFDLQDDRAEEIVEEASGLLAMIETVVVKTIDWVKKLGKKK